MTKKNISLITWLGTGNFGTSLQSYALHKKLELMGYNVHFLSPFETSFDLHNILSKKLRITLNFFRMLRDWIFNRENTKQRKIQEFNRQKYEIKTIHTKKAYKRLLDTVDVFITGSDQIWNTYVEYSPFRFLSFAGEVKRIAYASSIGTASIPEQYKDKLAIHLSKFQHIGVREQSAVSILKELLGRDDVIQVLDPTFLLTPNDWHELGEEAVIEISIPQKYILCYLIGQNEVYKASVLDIMRKAGINDVIIIPALENPLFMVTGAKTYSNAGPKEFVYLLEHASIVCTDSFHATALSINMSIDFVELLRFSDTDETSQNTRIYDLLNHYGLCDRLHTFQMDNWMFHIDYQPIQTLLKADRECSSLYLINAIEF